MDGTIVVFSHLRWNFVYQRPQQILSRLARTHRILFIEEPVPADHPGEAWNLTTAAENVLVCQPRIGAAGDIPFNDSQLPSLRAELCHLLQSHDVREHLAWFYSPMAEPLLEVLQPQAVIYDCMDELSAFLNPPPQLIEREQSLLKRADVVFTGGRSLYLHKKNKHRNVKCFPSSVDVAHFSRARQEIDEAADQQPLPRPRLGFFGVIDERMDLQLLDAMSQAHPEWSIALVGPVVKIDPATLPRRSNIHYFGQRKYEELPAFLKGWDVCLLPFALNRATQFISPTKTLEYMAAEKPIVSTPITDVAEPYGEIVHLGRTADEFIGACEQALRESADERERRFAGMRNVLASTSWESTVNQMRDVIEPIVQGRKRPTQQGRVHQPQRQPHPVIVIGAGPTGLSAAYHLGPIALLLEQNDQIGGWCRSFVDRGFTFDWAGHIMFSKDEYVHDMYRMLLGDNVHWQDREAFIFSKGVYTRYPFQGCLYGLPVDVITECIMGAIEARFGSAQQNAELEDAVSKSALKYNGNGATAAPRANGHARINIHTNGNGNGHAHAGHGSCRTLRLQDCCGDGIAESEVMLRTPQTHEAHHGGSSEPANFEEFIYKVWGKGIARHFAIPYNQKLWAVPLHEMETSWLGGRVPMPDIEEMIRYALTPAAKPMGPNARFGYPLRGGFQALMNGFLPHVQDRLRLNSRVARISPRDHVITLDSGEQLEYEQLISTMPLPVLIKAVGEQAPEEVRRAAAGLRYVSVRCVNLGIGRPNITEKHWVYYPEHTVFHRIFFQGNASPHCNPPGGFGLTCEITYSPSKPLPCDGQALIDRCIEDCRSVGLITPDDPIWAANQVDLPYAYVVYDHARPQHVATIRAWLEAHDIFVAGRYGQWEYFNSDHAFITGKRAAEEVLRRRQSAAQPSLPRLQAESGAAVL